MRTAQPSMGDLLRALFAAHSDGQRVMLPARVLAWDAATPEEAIVQPTVRLTRRQPDGIAVSVRPPPLPRCPIAWPGGGDYAITWPLERGDTGMLVFADRSMDEWLITGDEDATPQHPRRHAYTDGVYVPGLRASGGLAASQVDSDGMTLSGDRIYLGTSGLTTAHELAYRQGVQTALDALATVLDAWVPVPTDGGAALSVALKALIVSGWPSVTGTTTTRAE